MFRRPTVFVIGAGASAEAGLPVGKKLKEQIAEMLDVRFEYGIRQTHGNFAVVEALRKIVSDAGQPQDTVNEYLAAGRKFVAAEKHTTSIDSFLDTHSNDQKLITCGKLAIALAITLAERNSSMMEKRDGRFVFTNSSASQKWYGRFFAMCIGGVRTGQINQLFENVTIICFNYDRCIEQYLVSAVAEYFSLDSQNAARIVSKLRIIHPYGSLGRLAWQEGHTPKIMFGDELETEELIESASSIRTFGESVADNHNPFAIRESLHFAEKVIFLGFSFQEQNMELLNCEEDCKLKRIFATSLGFTPYDNDAIVQRITRSLKNVNGIPSVLAQDCVTFLDTFQLSLAD